MGSERVRPPEDTRARSQTGLSFALAGSPNPRDEAARAGDECEKDRGVFRRVVAAGLRAQRQRGGERESEKSGKSGFL